VEHITRERIRHEPERMALRLRLPPLLCIVLLTLMVLTVANMGTRSLAQYMPALPDPFPDYADILPGQPASAVQARGFSCDQGYSSYLNTTHILCTLIPAGGDFSSIQVRTNEGNIRETTFIMRDNRLKVGDLERLLDTRSAHSPDHVANFFLPKYVVIAKTIDPVGHFSRFLPVWSISFTETHRNSD
jgi:hypothetical protein